MFPTSLKEVPLHKFVEWHSVYDGKAESDYHLYLCMYAHYTGTPVQEVAGMKEYELVPIVKSVSDFINAGIIETMIMPVKSNFIFNEEVWAIQPITGTGILKSAELWHCEDIAIILDDYTAGNHNAWYALCAAYVRHPNEPYSTELMESRVETMKTLPLYYAIMVQQYLERHINEYTGYTHRGGGDN